jgi:formylglycine-generating enzyme required for sulfatase activity
MRISSVRFGAAAGALVLLLAGCGKPQDQPSNGPAISSTPAAKAGGPSAGTEVATKSGVLMVFIPGGEFTMGSDKGNPDEAPKHQVKVSSFLMDKYEVTQAMFAKAQLPNPSKWQDDPQLPVERLRWRDAKQYCNERSLLEGLTPCYDEKKAGWPCNFEANGYRLPTEAEWEYAARAGTEGDYDFGQASRLKQYGWYEENSQQRTHPAGQKKANAWGLHDMYGNVAEWCEDIYSPTYYKESPAENPRGAALTSKDFKSVLRGGSWKASAEMCRAAYRQSERSGDTDACFYTDFVGFRCVRNATADEAKAMASAAPK